MSYDDIDESFKGEPTVDFGDFTCTPEGFDEEGEIFRLNYKDGRAFRGTCKDLKPWNGEMAFPGQFNHGPVSCRIKDGNYWQGIIRENGSDYFIYEEGKRQSYDPGLKHKQDLNSNSKLVPLVAATALAAIAGATMQLNKTDKAETQADEVLEQLVEENTETQQYFQSPQDTPVYIENLSPEERIKKFGNLTKECNSYQESRILAAKTWVDANIGKIGNALSNWYEIPTNSVVFNTIIYEPRFPKDLTTSIEEIYSQNSNPRFYCPGTSTELLGLNTQFRDDDPEKRGEVALYDQNFYSENNCRLAATWIHEVLHNNSSWDHSEMGDVDQYDWVYIADDIAESMCENTK